MSTQDYNTATRLRDSITRIASSLIDQLRPEPRMAQVISINRFNRTAQVVFPGAQTATEVKLSSAFAPYEHTDGQEGGIGAVVEVTGNILRGYRITDLVWGVPFHDRPHMFEPVFNGGDYFNEENASFFTNTYPLPSAVGYSYHVGRYGNPTSLYGGGGQATVRLVVQQCFFTATHKVYEFVTTGYNMPDWQTLVPVVDNGAAFGNDFSVEIKTGNPGTGFDLRVRRLSQGPGVTPGGYRVSLWIHGNEFYRQPGALGEMTDPQPIGNFGAVNYAARDADGSVDQGPFFNSLQFTMTSRFHDTLHHAGAVLWDGTNFDWTGTMFAEVGRGWWSQSGYWAIIRPATGTVIPVHGSSSYTSHTMAATGIALSTEGQWGLYYEPQLGADSTSDPTKFHLVGVTAPFTIPQHWILIAQRTGTSAVGPSLKMGSGELVDHWHDLTYASGFRMIGGTSYPLQWRFRGNTAAEMRGRVQKTSGADMVNNETVTTLPAAARPPVEQAVTISTDNASNARAGAARIQAAGAVIFWGNAGAGVVATYGSFDGVSWSLY